MRQRQALSGWYVISLRPPDGHAGLRRAAAALGVRVFALSALRTRAQPAAVDTRDCRVAIVTSPVAARLALASGWRPRRGQACYAVGAGTAAVLRRGGVADVRSPGRGAGSEALLAIPALDRLHGQRVALLTGAGGRDLLPHQLVRRGARLRRIDLYRREPLAFTTARLDLLQALPACTALLVSSGEAFVAAWRQLAEGERSRWRTRLAIASSPRLSALLGEHGFRRVVVADDARPTSLLAALRRSLG
jgi:uroporphyrinogen-III synthase